MVWLFLAVALALVLVMAAAWAVQRAAGNAGWADVFWTYGTGLGGAVCALWPLGAPPTARQWVVAALALLWAARLGTHIAQRTLKGAEDVRYARFREDWGAAFQPRMLGFLMIQAAATWPLLAAMLLAARNPAPGLGVAGWLGILLMLVAVAGEALADRQLRAYRAEGHKGGICEKGLWGWSRHPNYFFEWLGWLAYPLLAFAPGGAWPWGWAALVAPAFMYLLLVHVSGIPPTEREMLRSRGERFRDYQRRVSAFWPLPPSPRSGASR